MHGTGQLVIVAIPADDDRTWKVSSEEVPHMTLMYLGEQDGGQDVERIWEFLAHTAKTSMYRFGLNVDRRGKLGDKEADVLFFGKSMANWLNDVRSYLLTDHAISNAYHSTEQFPTFTPHLTLGYPDNPAKEDDRDYGINWVQFDKVALWVADFEGPEIVLSDRYSYDDGEVAMSDDVDEFLEHFGVKGMRWGVRRSRTQLDADSSDFTNAQGIKAKGKRSGVRSLSNQEIQSYLARLGLEKQYKQTKPSAKAAKFVSDLLLSVGRSQATTIVNNYATQSVARATRLATSSSTRSTSATAAPTSNTIVKQD